MPIPLRLAARILQWVVRATRSAFKEATLLKKTEEKWIGGYRVEIERRVSLGRDGGISQMVRIFRGGITEQVWHIVVKAGKIIHKHLSYERK